MENYTFQSVQQCQSFLQIAQVFDTIHFVVCRSLCEPNKRGETLLAVADIQVCTVTSNPSDFARTRAFRLFETKNGPLKNVRRDTCYLGQPHVSTTVPRQGNQRQVVRPVQSAATDLILHVPALSGGSEMYFDMSDPCRRPLVWFA